MPVLKHNSPPAVPLAPMEVPCIMVPSCNKRYAFLVVDIVDIIECKGHTFG